MNLIGARRCVNYFDIIFLAHIIGNKRDLMLCPLKSIDNTNDF
jgi:hypothetical protein